MNSIKKIVAIGPESTGKSTLCKQLAEHYNTLWVPEYAREYLEKNGHNYSYDDLLTIAKGQIESEEKILSTANSQLTTVFIDTDMYVMKVWCEFAFGKCHNWILNQIVDRKYDFYLLCNTDMAWVRDDLREYPEPQIREKLFHYYKELMINQNVPWVNIKGNYEQRLQTAIDATASLFR